MLDEGIWTKCDCGLQHLLWSWSLSKLLPFMISSLLLTVGHRPAFGIRGGSGMIVSMGIRCLSVARRINHRLFKHNFQLCFSNFQLCDKMENPTPPCWPGCQPFHPETNLSVLDVNCQHLKPGLGTLPHGMPLVSDSTQCGLGGFSAIYKDCRELFRESKVPAPSQADSPRPAKKKAKRVTTPTACSNH